MIDYCFISRWRIFHLYGEFFTNMETSPIPVKGCRVYAYVRRSGPLSRKGSLSCHTCSESGPRFNRSPTKNRSIQSPLTTHEGVWRIYSNPNPTGLHRGCWQSKCSLAYSYVWLPRRISIWSCSTLPRAKQRTKFCWQRWRLHVDERFLRGDFKQYTLYIVHVPTNSFCWKILYSRCFI
jgi:hypothetical protein